MGIYKLSVVLQSVSVLMLFLRPYIFSRHGSRKHIQTFFSTVYKPRVTDLVRRNKKIGTLYILDNITEEYHHAKKIERMALTDAMTEFENRRAYEFKIAELQDNGIPDGTVYISFDVNGLKQVNDRRYNHCL